MTGRRSVWSDPRVIELAKEFVASTDEVWRLQRGTDPECVFFQKMAEQGHYGGSPGSSRQGIYVCAPSGEFLASINSNDPDRVLETMKAGLAAWGKLPANERRLKAAQQVTPKHRWEDSYPADGLVLNVFSRDLPEKCDPTVPCEVKWNQDYVWYSKSEARDWLGKDPQPGDVHVLPAKLINRLVRFHFVDNVKGQTDPFRTDSVEGSEIKSEIVERRGPIVRLRLLGKTQGVAPSSWWQTANGVATRLLGEAEYDLEKQQFTAMEFVALGRRWGATRFNGRHRDPTQGPLGYVFRLVDANSPRVAPAWITEYNADWLVRPATNE